jgi:D-3-phosphoglycerate dehydrogenase
MDRVVSMNEIILFLDPVTKEAMEVIKGLAPGNFDVRFARPGGELDNSVYSLDVNYFVLASSLVTKELMEKYKALKLVQKTGAGTENIDKVSAAALGIPVAITPGANSPAVAEMVILYILALYRKLIEMDRETKAGRWLMWEKRLECFELRGKEVGLIGFGNIGKALNQRLQAFEAKVSYYDIKLLSSDEEEKLKVKYKTIEEILKESDIISLHLPLTESTRNLIGKEQFNMIKPNSILINTARGPVIDEEALIKALEENKLAGVALDTYCKEPIESDNPLLKFPNVITTPHVGAGTIDTWKTVLKCAFENIEKVSKGQSADYIINK